MLLFEGLYWDVPKQLQQVSACKQLPPGPIWGPPLPAAGLQAYCFIVPAATVSPLLWSSLHLQPYHTLLLAAGLTPVGGERHPSRAHLLPQPLLLQAQTVSVVSLVCSPALLQPLRLLQMLLTHCYWQAHPCRATHAQTAPCRQPPTSITSPLLACASAATAPAAAAAVPHCGGTWKPSAAPRLHRPGSHSRTPSSSQGPGPPIG